MTQRMDVVRVTGRALLGCLLVTLLAAAPVLAQQGPPPNIPPNPPPGQAKPKPPLNHDRGGIPPRANPNPPGKNQQAPGQTKNSASSEGVAEISVSSVDGAASSAATAVAIANAGESVAAALRQGVFPAPGGITVSAETQQELLTVLSAAGANGAGSLERSLSARNASGAAEANLLVLSLEGLLVQPERLRDAVIAYNAFVVASSDSFLSDPPAELLGVQAVLASLVEASLEAEQPASNGVDRKAP